MRFDSTTDPTKAGPLRVLMFSGGSGSNRLTRAFLRQRSNRIRLQILINAYDDGKSTGVLRRDFGILGPSDIGKNLIASLDSTDRPWLAELLEYSWPTTADPNECFVELKQLASGGPSNEPLKSLFERCSLDTCQTVRQCLQSFLDLIAHRLHRSEYDLRDFRMRNLLVVGALAQRQGDYSAAIQMLTERLGGRAEILLNDVQDVHLAALTVKHELLADEASIVDDWLDQDIDEVILLNRPLTADEQSLVRGSDSAIARQKLLRELSAEVHLSDAAQAGIRRADLIVFAPTTIDSSLTPTLLSRGCWRALLESRGRRVFVANLVRERGVRSLADQLRQLERWLQRELGSNYFLHDVLDLVVAQSGLSKTGLLTGSRRIPVDRHEIESLGVELIEADIEDPEQAGFHHGEKLTEILVNFAKVERPATSRLDSIRRHLKCLVSDPLQQRDELPRLDRILSDASGELDRLQVRDPIRVVIAANGRGSRMPSGATKPLFPIADKPALLHLVERVVEFDSEFMVVTNSENHDAISASLADFGGTQRTICVPPRGSGAAVLAALQQLDSATQHVMVVWADAPNVQKITMRRAIAAHRTLADGSATIATCWEPEPYAGIERDAQGGVVGIFQTKVNPSTRRSVGEHDASLFVLDRRIAMEVLMEQQHAMQQESPPCEVDLLQALDRLPARGHRLTALTIADPLETQGFNTVEEARIVSESSQTLSERQESERYVLRGTSPLSASHKNDRTPNSRQPAATEVSLEAMQGRLRMALQRSYHGFAVDVDGNLIDARERLTSIGLQALLDLARRGVPVGLITGRRLDSLQRLLLRPIVDAFAREPEALQRFYVYPFNGAVGFRLDAPAHRFHDRVLPCYLSTASMRVLREQVLHARDSYDITDYKITVWPGDPRQQSQMVVAINQALALAQIPVQAQVSGSPTYNGAIVMTSTEYRSQAGKAVALADFAIRTGIDIDRLAKVGDQAGPAGVDHELLQGPGSFSTETCDPSCPEQVSLPWVTGKQHLEAFEWLVARLDFVKHETAGAVDRQVTPPVKVIRAT